MIRYEERDLPPRWRAYRWRNATPMFLPRAARPGAGGRGVVTHRRRRFARVSRRRRRRARPPDGCGAERAAGAARTPALKRRRWPSTRRAQRFLRLIEAPNGAALGLMISVATAPACSM
jgi:hypothetical protein